MKWAVKSLPEAIGLQLSQFFGHAQRSESRVNATDLIPKAGHIIG